MSRSLAVVVNADAGPGNDAQGIAALHELFHDGGLAVRILPARSGDELRSITRSALREKPRIIVAGGGDGTLSAVASLLVGTDTALGVLPLGTLNHFARDLRIPTQLDQAVAVLAAGYQTRIDLGEVNGRTFLNNSSLGLYPGIVRDRERQQRSLGRGKRWALVLGRAHRAASRTVSRREARRRRTRALVPHAVRLHRQQHLPDGRIRHRHAGGPAARGT